MVFDPVAPKYSIAQYQSHLFLAPFSEKIIAAIRILLGIIYPLHGNVLVPLEDTEAGSANFCSEMFDRYYQKKH